MPEYVGIKDSTFWDSVCGSSVAGKVIMGYESTKQGPIIAFGTEAYTIQIWMKFDGSNKAIRNYYADTHSWNAWDW